MQVGNGKSLLAASLSSTISLLGFAQEKQITIWKWLLLDQNYPYFVFHVSWQKGSTSMKFEFKYFTLDCFAKFLTETEEFIWLYVIFEGISHDIIQ